MGLCYRAKRWEHDAPTSGNAPSIPTMLTNHTLPGVALTLALTALAVGAIGILDDWVGDLGAMLWIASGFWWPFIAGVAWGIRGNNRTGRIVGGLIGAAVVLLPGIGYAIVESPDLAELQLPLLWALFTPLAFAQGVITLPVGARVRNRPKD